MRRQSFLHAHGENLANRTNRNLAHMGSVQYAMLNHPTNVATHGAAAVLVLALTACTASQGDAEPTHTERPARTDAVIATIAPDNDAPVTGEVPADLLAAILADAADRSGLDAAEIEELRAESTTWPDGSLGCPEPGQVYTQALVDGYHIVLDAAGDELDYRATTSGSFQLCEATGPPSEGSSR